MSNFWRWENKFTSGKLQIEDLPQYLQYQTNNGINFGRPNGPAIDPTDPLLTSIEQSVKLINST